MAAQLVLGIFGLLIAALGVRAFFLPDNDGWADQRIEIGLALLLAASVLLAGAVVGPRSAGGRALVAIGLVMVAAFLVLVYFFVQAVSQLR